MISWYLGSKGYFAVPAAADPRHTAV